MAARATSGRQAAVALVIAMLAVWSTGCSTPSPPSPPPSQPPSTTSQTVCFSPPPAWTQPDKGVPIPAGTTFGAHSVVDNVVFGQLQSSAGRGVAAVDLTTRQLAGIADYQRNVSGLGAMAAEGPWVVWEQLNSTTNLADWSVHAVNRQSGDNVVVATSRLPGGGFAAGQQPLPVLRHGQVAWAHPVPSSSGTVQSELRVMNLATRESRKLDTGRLSSPVYAGPYLLWAKVDSAMRYSLHAVDEATLQPVELPEPIRDPGSVAYLGGSSQRLVWSNQDSTVLEVWHFAARQRTSFTIADRSHFFQFLQVSGDFLLWQGGITASVLDLRTGAAFDLPGTVTGSADWIVASHQGHISRVAVADAPRIRCGV